MKHSIQAKLFAGLPHTSSQDVVQFSDKSASVTSIDYLEETAIVTATIRPYHPGQISFRGSWWRAVCGQNVELPEGTRVFVVGIRNITYVVEPFVR